MLIKAEFLPFAVFIHVGIALNTLLLYEELNPLIEGSRDRGWLLPKKYLNRIIGCKTHYVIIARWM
jgi:hypothetical protein